MTKKEVIWREILYQARVNKIIKFTQKELAQKFGFSLSTVFNALKIPRESNAIKVTGRFFILKNSAKLLYLWATVRSLKKEIIYQGFSKLGITELEGITSPKAIFGLYSAFKIQFNQTPSDYDHLYIYIDQKDLRQTVKRFSVESNNKNNYSNICVLKKDSWLETYSQSATLPEQIFVDIWNAPEWYAKDFLKSLEDKIII